MDKEHYVKKILKHIKTTDKIKERITPATITGVIIWCSSISG